ncbi:unnamed protein product [Cylicostephanus goldi]|uniref:Uncharacterized protein n=1 Tax=Cylicostephanus goldi TaxID=71465 RepID=A0A3P7N1V4_CYLGO|nr:unnamed protein product [Cylicostephanus goldi]
MSLSLLTPRMISRQCLTRIIAIRSASGLKLRGEQSLKADPDQGYFKYERDISRDKRYSNPQKLGDTPMSKTQFGDIACMLGLLEVVICQVIHISRRLIMTMTPE